MADLTEWSIHLAASMTKSANLQSINPMKSLILVSVFTSLAASHGLAAVPAFRDAATHEQLSLAYRKAAQEEPTRKLALAKGPDPSTVNLPKDLISESDILCFNGNMTLVPKRAVLQIPKNLADRLKYQKGAKLMGWSEFFAINRGWITTQEVSRVQAEGNAPIAEEIQKQISKTGNLVVATYQAGPISVLPLKTPKETTTENTPKP
jgi:hypothetical protein